MFSQVARAILENPNDITKVHLVYANVTHDDILLKVESLLCYLLRLSFCCLYNISMIQFCGLSDC